MIKKLLFIGAAAALFFGRPSLLVEAQDVSEPETTSEVIEDPTTIGDTLNDQLDTIEGIIVALMVSFTGTGTIALIGRVAIGKLTKKMSQKVLEAENQNKISTQQAQQAMQSIVTFEQVLKGQVDALDETIKGLIENQNITNEQIKLLLDEYKARDQQIKDLIIKEFGDEINEE